MAGRQPVSTALRRTTETLSKQQCRTFTSTSRTSAGGAGGVGGISGLLMKNMRAQRSMQSQMSKMKRGEIPTDMGLLPDTLVKPARKDLPSLFSSRWRRRMQIEWRALLQKSIDFFRFVYTFKIVAPKDPLTNKRKRAPLLLRERYIVARDLHTNLYTALAASDSDTIERIACTGLQRNLMIKLDYRRAARLPQESWTVKYKGFVPQSASKWLWPLEALLPPSLKSAQIVSDRISSIPIGREGSLRQVVVRLRSQQTLDKGNGNVKEADKSELVVIQKMKIDGEEDDWKIWGTTEATTEKEIDELLAVAKQKPSLGSRIADKFMTMGGSKAAESV